MKKLPPWAGVAAFLVLAVTVAAGSYLYMTRVVFKKDPTGQSRMTSSEWQEKTQRDADSTVRDVSANRQLIKLTLENGRKHYYIRGTIAQVTKQPGVGLNIDILSEGTPVKLLLIEHEGFVLMGYFTPDFEGAVAVKQTGNLIASETLSVGMPVQAYFNMGQQDTKTQQAIDELFGSGSTQVTGLTITAQFLGIIGTPLL